MIKIDAFKTTLQTVFSDKKNIIIAGLCVVVIIFAWNVFGGGNNDSGADRVTDNIFATGNQLQSAGTAITEGQRTADEIHSTNNEITKSISASQSINQSSRSLISRGQQILQGVQQRAEENSAAVKN